MDSWHYKFAMVISSCYDPHINLIKVIQGKVMFEDIFDEIIFAVKRLLP